MSDVKRDDDRVHPLSRRLKFIEAPGFGRMLMFAFGAAAIALALVDVFHHRHHYAFDFEELIRGFHGLYGFAAFSFVVIMGWPLRALLSRPESYYGEGEEDD